MSFSLTQFGPSGHRDDRRRRLLAEEQAARAGTAAAVAASPTSRVADPPVRKTEHYGDALFLAQQPTLSDLVPRRLIGFALVFLALSLLIGGLEALYAWMPSLVGDLGHAASGQRGVDLAALDLAGKGSLAAWFSSLLLLAAGLAAVLVYTVRRHRMDDYHGRYRVWLWAALCWFLAATDTAASLHEGFRDLMTAVTGTPLLGDGSIWWMIAYGLLLGAVGARLLIDIWPSRLAAAAMLLAACAYVAAASVQLQLGWPAIPSGGGRVMFQQGSAMAGHLLVLLAMGLQARYVLADARGLLPPRRRKAAATPGDKKTADDPWVAVDSPHGGPQPVFRRASTVTAPATAKTAPAATPVSSAAAPVQQKLSKAERKALKHRLIQERLKRQHKADTAWGG
jgi:hypothetical protein